MKRNAFKELKRLVNEAESFTKIYFPIKSTTLVVNKSSQVAPFIRSFTSTNSSHGLSQVIRASLNSTIKSQHAHLPPLAARQLLRQARSFENTLFKRLFSSNEPPPRRGWEKFYPKGKPRRPAATQSKNPKGTACTSHSLLCNNIHHTVFLPYSSIQYTTLSKITLCRRPQTPTQCPIRR